MQLAWIASCSFFTTGTTSLQAGIDDQKAPRRKVLILARMSSNGPPPEGATVAISFSSTDKVIIYKDVEDVRFEGGSTNSRRPFKTPFTCKKCCAEFDLRYHESVDHV